MMLNKLDQKKPMSCKYFFPFFCSVIHDKMVGMYVPKITQFDYLSPKVLVLIIGNNLDQITCLFKWSEKWLSSVRF